MELYSKANIPTAHGHFDFSVYKKEDGEEITVLSLGDFSKLDKSQEVFVRIHSECVTSEIFGSLKCDCKNQLDLALKEIQTRELGILIYLKQEGRGIGLGNKIKAYDLQAKGLDTVEANHKLGFETDLRSYDDAIIILKKLRIEHISINTNNPLKIEALENSNFKSVTRKASVTISNVHNQPYIDTKKSKCGHLF